MYNNNNNNPIYKAPKAVASEALTRDRQRSRKQVRHDENLMLPLQDSLRSPDCVAYI